ncbi:unnamed protein product (macronuclear) [Paramecium tetraurelia]|uniref:Uncharacterized protein n=1 Tax=Paramecium tetraurelia TaxID=5888 RepID=A0BIW2_PARTE|nr:uncharacterized protein GSPATT00004852001 [Paramecium tetraurelia]CAK58479.1 unnamed protein product [Paramecium tetraurelia]|eukprot:XP_001425877.1 hypothetical protein (macronuclear) [Paramecium tetraurelia strain d4-2]
MIEKSKIRQMLLDKSLGQILKVDGPVECIQNEDQLVNLQAFHQHFHTTAKREHSATSRFRNKVDKIQDEFWKCIRPRTPSVSINCRQRVTIFEEQKDFQLQQATNFVIPWEPTRKHIPLDKQTKRKSWHTQVVMPDLNHLLCQLFQRIVQQIETNIIISYR